MQGTSTYIVECETGMRAVGLERERSREEGGGDTGSSMSKGRRESMQEENKAGRELSPRRTGHASLGVCVCVRSLVDAGI